MEEREFEVNVNPSHPCTHMFFCFLFLLDRRFRTYPLRPLSLRLSIFFLSSPFILASFSLPPAPNWGNKSPRTDQRGGGRGGAKRSEAEVNKDGRGGAKRSEAEVNKDGRGGAKR
eukprot:Hpha_TRINITY_DN16007_c3_g1::TRINITY_DN16007_c3_g1_i2::g.117597::m.117597